MDFEIREPTDTAMWYDSPVRPAEDDDSSWYGPRLSCVSVDIDRHCSLVYPMDPRQTAYHEAGHAVAAVVLDTGLISVGITPKPVHGGGTGLANAMLRPPPDDQILGKGEAAAMPYLVTFLADWIAEQVIEPMAAIEVDHAQSDGEMVRRYAFGAICTPTFRDGKIVLLAEEQEAKREHIDALFDVAESRAREFVSRHANAIAAVASALLQHQQLSLSEVEQLVYSHPPAEE